MSALIRPRLVVPVILILLIAGLVAWRLTRPLDVPVLALESNVPVTLFGLGNVDAERVSRAGFDVSGIMAEIRVRVGDSIRAGDTIARLDTRLQALRVAAATDALKLAEATIRQSQARIGTSTATVALKHQLAERARMLQTRNAGTAAAAEDATADAAVAEAQNVESQRALDGALAQLQQAQTALAQEREVLAHHELRAPFDAIVTERLAVEGAVVQAGQPVVTLVARDSLRIMTFINEGLAGSLRPGQKASIVLRSRPSESFAGHVDRIEPASDRTTEERSVSVVFDQAPDVLFLAEQAEVRIDLGTIQKGYLVPERAVHDRDGGGGIVWAVENGRLAERRVELGRRLEDGRLEITSPLPDGVRIAAERLPDAKLGETARIEEPHRP